MHPKPIRVPSNVAFKKPSSLSPTASSHDDMFTNYYYFLPFPTRKGRGTLVPQNAFKWRKGCPVRWCCGSRSLLCLSITAGTGWLQHPTPTPCASRRRGGIWGIALSPGKGPPPSFLAQTSTYCNSSAFGNFAPHQQPPPETSRRRTKGQRTKSRGGVGKGEKGELPPFGSDRRPSPPAAPGSALPACHEAPAAAERGRPGVAVGAPPGL